MLKYPIWDDLERKAPRIKFTFPFDACNGEFVNKIERLFVEQKSFCLHLMNGREEERGKGGERT